MSAKAPGQRCSCRKRFCRYYAEFALVGADACRYIATHPQRSSRGSQLALRKVVECLTLFRLRNLLRENHFASSRSSFYAERVSCLVSCCTAGSTSYHHEITALKVDFDTLNDILEQLKPRCASYSAALIIRNRTLHNTTMTECLTTRNG